MGIGFVDECLSRARDSAKCESIVQGTSDSEEPWLTQSPSNESEPTLSHARAQDNREENWLIHYNPEANSEYNR
jgi:hypothetical protein